MARYVSISTALATGYDKSRRGFVAVDSADDADCVICSNSSSFILASIADIGLNGAGGSIFTASRLQSWGRLLVSAVKVTCSDCYSIAFWMKLRYDATVENRFRFWGGRFEFLLIVERLFRFSASFFKLMFGYVRNAIARPATMCLRVWCALLPSIGWGRAMRNVLLAYGYSRMLAKLPRRWARRWWRRAQRWMLLSTK
jgi:hypothetical protein